VQNGWHGYVDGVLVDVVEPVAVVESPLDVVVGSACAAGARRVVAPKRRTTRTNSFVTATREAALHAHA